MSFLRAYRNSGLRCGFKPLQSFYQESNNTSMVRDLPVMLYQRTHTIPVSDSHIGYLSSAMFAGMMLGAVGWGSCTFAMSFVSITTLKITFCRF